MDAISQLCRPELREESVEIRQDPDSVASSALQDPLQQQQEQMQAALASVGISPQAMAMNSSQREAMQQQMQMFQEYMMPMLGGLGLAGPPQVHSHAVNVISNAPPTPTAGMSGLSCNVCAMIMPDLPTLEQHLRIHEEEKPYKCIQCGQRYKYQSAYQRHIDMNHTARLPQEKPYKCEVCGQFFKYLKSFHKHRANHSAIDRILNDPSTGDDVSGLQLTSETMMAALAGYQQRVIQQQVMSGHPEMYQQQLAEPPPSEGETDRKASAPLEDKQMRTERAEASEMREDDKASITITAINPSSAATAGTSQIAEVTPPVQVKSPQQADQDPTNDHDEAAGTTSDGAPRSWICPYCLKGFRGKENLKLHIRTHTGEKPYECGMCPKRFVGKSDLNRHLRIHTGEKPYECNICMRRFARGDYLSKHMVTHGVEDVAGSGSLMTSDNVVSPGEEEDDTTMANMDEGSPPSAGAEVEDAELEDQAMQKEGADADAAGELSALASVAEDASK